MKKMLTYLLAVTFALHLAACGGGGGAGAGAGASSSFNSTNIEIACTPVTNKSDLNVIPVYAFGGLQSNWANRDLVAGASSIENFVAALSNYSAIAKDKNDVALKSEVLSSIYRWSSADAFKGSRMCWSATTGMWDSTCTQWTDPEGNDLSPLQDNNFIVQAIESIRSSYSLISDWARVNDPTKHQNISAWLNYWDLNTPDPDPNNVFFGLGMGRFQWEIQRVFDSGGVQATIPLVNQLMSGILNLLNEDGSIVDRTTRGNRALWYHFTSINEVVTSMYLAKRAGVQIDSSIENRLHKAVEIFLNTLDDPKYILPWASVGFNNGGDGTQQEFFSGRVNDFTGWYDNTYAGSWVYLYSNWYATNNNSLRLRQLVPMATAKSAQVDTQFGIPLGCLIN